ncbi:MULTISPECIES: DUF202 domain-containing protein [unclassified Kocuria]|uniref:DUF202 domain-containing protein n=1 Tax=unclassified Kocuria TaxID=2649579 RepID=UPI00064A225E|nr:MULTISPECIES: DUF202 domain-containing protein [unclassified Kocuria]KLU11068.1 membrane protein [Kocuria sp. SM24M-10]OLT07234.1 hypothetical protein BJF77_02885 [Kocuria sp. CNJ-770]
MARPRSRRSAPPPERPHADLGLQPERTTMAWGRTLMSFVVVSAVFLRWLPQHGPFVLVLFGLAVLTAGSIYLTQRPRYARSARGISREESAPEAGAVLATALAVLVLGALGVWVVLVLV